MKYKGRLTTFFLVLTTNLIYIAYYFIRDGGIAVIEIIGLPVNLALAWWLGKQYDIVGFFAERDVLTEIYNRRFLLRFFPKLIALAERKGENLGIAIVDINDFKGINDTYGHITGDQVLQGVSNILTQSTKKSEIVVRWGGDEFLIICPDTDKKKALSMIKRVENRLDELDRNISVSIGVAIFPNDAKTLEGLLKVADHRMYQFKPQNYNRMGG